MKKLYRNKKNRIWMGVIGGLGEYFNIDPTILRLIWVLVTVFTGIFPCIIIYIAAAIIIPEE
ncbi:MAG: PspC domain-containing protein [bacterium]